jgi:hypothetical protein
MSYIRRLKDINAMKLEMNVLYKASKGHSSDGAYGECPI